MAYLGSYLGLPRPVFSVFRALVSDNLHSAKCTTQHPQAQLPVKSGTFVSSGQHWL
jgi:hypothetical protein